MSSRNAEGAHVFAKLGAVSSHVLVKLGAVSSHVLAKLGAMGRHILTKLEAEGFKIGAGSRLGRGGCACHIQSLAQAGHPEGREMAYSRASARASQLASIMSVELPTVVQ